MKPVLSVIASRRALVLAGGAVAVAGIGAGALIGAGKSNAAGSLGEIDPRKISALGEGFYLADGWVLTADDLKAMGLPRPSAE